MKRLFVKAGAVAMALAIATACSPTSEPEQASLRAASFIVAEQLSMAHEGGASDAQIAVLEQAAARGELTYEDVQTAFGNLLTCFDSSGITYEVLGPKPIAPNSTILVPDYLAYPPPGMAQDDADLLFMACNHSEVEYVFSAYSSQPEAFTAQMEIWNVPEVRECLEKRGYSVSEDASGYEINLMVLEDSQLHGGEPGYMVCVPDWT